MRLLTYLALSSIFCCVTATAGPPATDPDTRAAATEASLTDEERFQLLRGIMPLPMAGSPPPPVGIPYTAGYIQGIPRLGIPDLLETDASLGVTNPMQLRKDDVSTALPSGLALAATFNPRLAFAGGTMAGAETRAKGFNILLGGGVNLARDPRNGRNFEYLGEDPLLAGVIAGEAIRGIQSAGVVSTVKHYALNAQETLRSSLNATIAEAGLRESDLLAFQIAIERGQPGSVMCAYNQVNGEYACGNDFLLNTVLKHDWHYPGWVMSDWGAVHDVSYFAKGLDQQSGSQLDKQVWFDGPLRAEVAAGNVPKARVSDAVRRILRSLYAVGADRPLAIGPIDFAAHAKIARETAEQGIVVLKNEGILPLSATTRSILVVGGHADFGVLSGGGSSQVTPSNGAPLVIPMGGDGMMAIFNRQLYMPSSPLAALKAALPNATISYDSGYERGAAAAQAKHADLVIVFATRWQGEASDSDSLSLPDGQDALIAGLANANSNIVVVLETGNPVAMPWLADVKGVIAAWYPGQEGGAAIADVLSGAVNPSGRLPITFPRSLTQNPRPVLPGLGLPQGSAQDVPYPEGSDVGYRWFAAHGEVPLFAFGHGLSYASFAHDGLKLVAGKTLTASFTVTNTGARAGADVPQLYLVSAAGHKRLRLAGFDKVELAPGASKSLVVTIDPRLLADWENGGWIIKGGTYGFALGKSATDLGPVVGIHLPERRMKP